VLEKFHFAREDLSADELEHIDIAMEVSGLLKAENEPVVVWVERFNDANLQVTDLTFLSSANNTVTRIWFYRFASLFKPCVTLDYLVCSHPDPLHESLDVRKTVLLSCFVRRYDRDHIRFGVCLGLLFEQHLPQLL
jgi:hypothetical protein